MTKDNDTYSTFIVNTENEPGYGVRGVKAGLIYEANFYKDTAERIVELLRSEYPPADWNATSQILTAEGYDVRCLTFADLRARDISPGRKHLRPVELAISGTIALGHFTISAAIDEDGHLTVVINSTDGSAPVDIEDDVGCEDGALGYRFTTERIEQDYKDATQAG